MKIKFGTDGWRAIIADDYTVANVKRVAQGTAKWVLKNGKTKTIVIGYDCRFGGKLFTEATAQVMCANGIKAFLIKDFISTPMISLASRTLQTAIGVIITASHNPPAYNGYKLKSIDGGPSDTSVVQEVEDLIPNDEISLNLKSIADYEKDKLIEYVDLEKMYLDEVYKKFKLDTIYNAKFHFAYDAMFGAGQNVMRKLFPNEMLLHCEVNPSFNGIPPEPIDKNLRELAELLIKEKSFKCGISTDGDADRIGMYDEEGTFVDSHHLILLLILYFHKYKKIDGKIVVAFSVSEKIKKMCGIYKLPIQITPVGFKYISPIMVKEDVLIGAEESGGLAVKGHIPERDGIWVALLILEFMAETGKSLKQLVQEVYSVVGQFYYDRYDWHLDEATKQHIIEKCKQNKIKSFGTYKINSTETIDGFKYLLDNEAWVLVRASGTEPLLRVYAETATKEETEKLLDIVKKELSAA
jgi:phosphomannomutase